MKKGQLVIKMQGADKGTVGIVYEVISNPDVGTTILRVLTGDDNKIQKLWASHLVNVIQDTE